MKMYTRGPAFFTTTATAMVTTTVTALVLITLLLSPVYASFKPATRGDVLVFGVAPSSMPEKTMRKWGPVIKYISRTSGIEIRLKTAATGADFRKHLSQGKYDIAYMNPNDYTIHNKSQGYLAFAKESNKSAKGIIVVRKDSPYKTLADLKDKTLAFPDQDNFSASVLPKAKLKNDRIPVKSSLVDSHKSVYKAVFKGKLPAGASVMDSYNNLNPGVNSKLRVLWTTKQYTSHAFAAHPDVSGFQRKLIQAALISMHEDPVGATMLQSIDFNQIELAQDKDWDDVRALHLNLSE